jgi:type IV secretion system protein VirB10
LSALGGAPADTANGSTKVPAIGAAGAAGGAGDAQASATQQKDAAQKMADDARRSPILAFNGGGNGAPLGAANATASGNGVPRASGNENAEEGNSGELDKLRQHSPISEERATMIGDRNFLITAGTHIPCTLQTALDSSQPGYTTCIIPRDIYSENGRVVLMEKGTKVVGEYRGGVSQGVNRLFVLWTRALTPRGVAIDLSSPAADALGRSGMSGTIDTFFWKRFGGALMLSLINDGTMVAGQRLAGNGSNTTQVPADTASVALQNSINIKPVLKKNQGESVGIFVSKDFDFSNVYALKLKR